MPEYTPEELIAVVKYLKHIELAEIASQADACNLYTALKKLEDEVRKL